MTATFLRWRRAALVTLVGLAAVLALAIPPALLPDNSLTVWFLEDDPQLAAYARFQDEFGNDEVILLHVREPGGVFAAEPLRRIARLTARLESIDGVERVESLTNARDLFDDADGIRFDQVLPETIPESAAALAGLRTRVLDSRLLGGRVVSGDGRDALIWIQMRVMDDIDTRRNTIVEQVRAAAGEILAALPHELGGVGVIYAGLNDVTQRDFARFVVLGYALMFAAMWWVFRVTRLVLAAIGVVMFANIVTLGIYGLAGYQLNMVTLMLPTLVLVLGIADAVHFPVAMMQEAESAPRESMAHVTRDGLRSVLFPCAFNTITTMAGFLALATSPMRVIRHLGVFTAIGLGAAFLASVVFMSAAFLKLPRTVRLPDHRWIRRLLRVCRDAVSNHGRLLGAAATVLILAAGWQALAVRADTYTLGYLPAGHIVVRDHQALERDWGPYTVLEFTIHPAAGLRVDSPDVMARLDEFVRRAEALPEIGRGASVATLYRRMAEVLGAPIESSAALAPDLVAQLQLVLEMKGLAWERSDPDYHDNFLAPLMRRDGSLGRVTLTSAMMSARELAGVIDRVEHIAADAFGGLARVQAAGYVPLYTRIIEYIVSSQIRGFFGALGVIFVLMLLWLRSFRLACISLIPNLFPVLILLGVMGALGIPLDVATATVCAIVIGVAMDDTVHFLYHWRRAEQAGLDWHGALERTHEGAGVPATVTALLLLAGFPVLMFAQVATVYYFGLLTSIAAVAGLAGDLVILPLLLRVFPAVRHRTAVRTASIDGR
ncbi:MAG TPA: MMPL family transporter [Vicinamibacterales bacterium]|nr:MMPL family transporter [Vicinamibacterales bacterium]